VIRWVQPDDCAFQSIGMQPYITSMIQIFAGLCGKGVSYSFWLSYDGKDTQGVICQNQSGGTWAAAAGEQAAQEIAEMIGFIGYSSLTADPFVARCITPTARALAVMELKETVKIGEKPKTPAPPNRFDIFEGTPSEAADINTLAGAPLRDEICAELNLRQRRAGALIRVCTAAQKAVSCGVMTPSRGYGVLGYIATRPEARGRGFAQALVTALSKETSELGLLPILSCAPSLVPFYKSLGFVQTGEIFEFIRACEQTG